MHFTCFCVSTLSGRWKLETLETQECSPSLAGNFVHSFHIYARSFSRRNENIVRMWQKIPWKLHDNGIAPSQHIFTLSIINENRDESHEQEKLSFSPQISSKETAKAAVLLFLRWESARRRKHEKLIHFSQVRGVGGSQQRREAGNHLRRSWKFTIFVYYILCFSFLLCGHVDGSRKTAESFHIKIKPKEYSVKMFLTFILWMSRDDVEVCEVIWIHIKYFAKEFSRNSSHFKLSMVLEFFSFFSIIDLIQQIKSLIRNISEKLLSVAARSATTSSLALG